MYLPIVLRERYGWWGVVVFAVPNVAGVMLFGWGVRSCGASGAMVDRHRVMMLWFSAITVAFHGWFFGWFWWAEMGVHPGWSIMIGLGMLFFGRVCIGLGDRALVWISGMVYGVSMTVLVLTAVNGWGVLTGVMDSPRVAMWEWAGAGRWIFLIPVMCAGFLFCPYFDLTFHRAYQETGGGEAGRMTFVMFGVFFTIMLGLTAVYSVTGFSRWIVVHLLLQGWLTTMLHMREIVKRSRSFEGEKARLGRMMRVPFVLVFFAPMVLIDYRDWFVFYGLVFPIYGMLRGLRVLTGQREANSVTIWLFALGSVPFGMAGFLSGHEWALLFPPFVVALVALWGGEPASRAGNRSLR